ncbi:Cellobiose dehydrogenase [Sphaceloma murrayae]|uniref:Cellobiose dehydrogenase n=1 Tax=Sphaceloma murrayae TaxID=2082308 RepID=A0A2K1QTD9_9PEZI|nr:Cellobiose dehydrogenase [Sphaceloma murrayae]
MSDQSSATPAELYDFVLVGAGTAACLITSRLSKQLPKARILVLEAGEHSRDDPNVLTPGLSSKLLSDPAYDWGYSTMPEAGLNDRRVDHPRGRLVGGSSAINSHSVVFPNHEWQDRIAQDLLSEAGRGDWTSLAMRDCYQRWQNQGSGTRADGGGAASDRVQTSFPRSLDLLQSRWIQAFEELGHVEGQTGFVQSSAGALTLTNAVDSSRGERSHAGTAFMEPALERGNVTLRTGVMVSKIVFDPSKNPAGKLQATGVCYTRQGENHSVRAREIIVCAGAFESPALLERSGIGSEAILAAANVPVLYKLPGVGENLQDHLNCSSSFEVRDDVPTRDEALRNPEEQKAALSEYERSRTGRMSEGPAYSYAFTPLQLLETSDETQELMDLVEGAVQKESNPGLQAQYSIIRKAIESPAEATATTMMLRCQRHRDHEFLPKDTPRYVDGNYATVMAMLAHPFSRGTCHMTPNQSRPPAIKFNYLSHPLDTEIMARHMRQIDRLYQQPSLADLAKPDGRRLPLSFPYPIPSLADAKNRLPTNSWTNYHPCGTCSMMREDLGGVVDEQLRVYGTLNLRVCDASVIPVIPRGNILAAVYAFAEKAAEIICRETKTWS